ncbi:MAG: hypothetical protein WBD67_09740 [Terracidiphilus sp.]
MKDPIPFHSPNQPSNRAEEAEATLRAVAQLPAVEGLEERVKTGVMDGLRGGVRPAADEDAIAGRRGWMHSAAMRGLAAAAIVLIVVGGGWGAARYGRRQATPQSIGIPRVAPQGNFSNAGAMRTPQTLTQPAVPKQRRKARAKDDKARKTNSGKAGKPTARDGRSPKTLNDGAPERR